MNVQNFNSYGPRRHYAGATGAMHPADRMDAINAAFQEREVRNPRRCAPLGKLLSIKDVDRGAAQAIRRRWRDRGNSLSYCRTVVDQLLGTSGVEYLGRHKRTGRRVYYCNAGDTYALTVIFHGKYLQVGCWGDLVERGLIVED